MTSTKRVTENFLFDLKYKYSMNYFHEIFGDNVTYHEIEQRSFIEFKEILFEAINDNIKVRKQRNVKDLASEKHKLSLTLGAELTKSEYEKFKKMIDNEAFDFCHDFIIVNLRKFSKEEMDDYEQQQNKQKPINSLNFLTSEKFNSLI